MSNITTVQRDELFDLTDLIIATEKCGELAWTNEKQYVWYAGMKTAKCDFEIKVMGTKNSIGVMLRDDGKCELRGDFENTRMREGINRLTRVYDMGRAEDAALARRWECREVESDRPGWVVQRIDIT